MKDTDSRSFDGLRNSTTCFTLAQDSRLEKCKITFTPQHLCSHGTNKTELTGIRPACFTTIHSPRNIDKAPSLPPTLRPPNPNESLIEHHQWYARRIRWVVTLDPLQVFSSFLFLKIPHHIRTPLLPRCVTPRIYSLQHDSRPYERDLETMLKLGNCYWYLSSQFSLLYLSTFFLFTDL